MSPELALQKAIGDRLAGTAAVTALVPAANILDRNERPAARPAIIFGEAQTLDEGDSIARNRHRIYFDLHIWITEPGTTGGKAVAWAIRQAIHAARLDLGAGLHCADARVSSQRFLRDPNGVDCHGVVTLDALVVEVAP